MDQFNKHIKVSILVPIYNVENYLERCVVSLFHQQFEEPYEVIFVNDCSKDKSLELLESLCKSYQCEGVKYQIISHPENRGLAGARETALYAASGEYVLTVDSDDWIELDTISTLYKAAKENVTDIAICNYFIDRNGKSIVVRQTPASTPIGYFINILLDKSHGGTCTQLIKRSLFVENNIHYFRGLNMLEDISVDYRIYPVAKSICFVDKPLYHYFQGNASSYCTTLSSVSKENMLALVDKMKDYFSSNKIENHEFQVALSCFSLNVKSWILLESSIPEIYKYRDLYNNLRWKNLPINRLYCMILGLTSINPYIGYLFCRMVKVLKSLR